MLRCKPLLLLAALLYEAVAAANDGLTINLPECTSRVDYRPTEADVLVIRPGCPLSIASLAKLLDDALRWKPTPDVPPIRAIYLGRLMDYPEWSKQLALGAADSKRWNSRQGKPSKRADNDNAVVAALLNGPAFPELLRESLARLGIKSCIGSVEKVLVFPAREIWPARPAGISPQAKLPVDAQVWLYLRADQLGYAVK